MYTKAINKARSSTTTTINSGGGGSRPIFKAPSVLDTLFTLTAITSSGDIYSAIIDFNNGNSNSSSSSSSNRSSSGSSSSGVPYCYKQLHTLMGGGNINPVAALEHSLQQTTQPSTTTTTTTTTSTSRLTFPLNSFGGPEGPAKSIVITSVADSSPE